MSDLISREDVLHELGWCDYGLKDWQKWKLKMMVRDIPSAESEIIRCKDCTHRYIDGENVLYNCCEMNHNKVQSDDWFCADGERREE